MSFTEDLNKAKQRPYADITNKFIASRQQIMHKEIKLLTGILKSKLNYMNNLQQSACLEKDNDQQITAITRNCITSAQRWPPENTL
jgi:hypothetical protein